MKKHPVIVAVAAVAIIGIVSMIMVVSFSGDSPERLLRQLAAGKGDRDDILMRLNVVQGDPVPAMINSFADPCSPSSFRQDVYGLLFKRHARSPDERVEAVLLGALDDADPAVRKKAAYEFLSCGQERLQLKLQSQVGNPDPEVRKEIYRLFGMDATPGKVYDGLWKLMTAQEKDVLVKHCAKQRAIEQNAELRYLASAVVGRQIMLLLADVPKYLQGGDIEKVDSIIKTCMVIDPNSVGAQAAMIHQCLRHGDKEGAVKLASQYGAMIEIPQLSEAPVIDGDPTDEVWRQAREVVVSYGMKYSWSPKPANTKNVFRAGHFGGKLYVSLIAYGVRLDRHPIKKGKDGNNNELDRDESAWVYVDSKLNDNPNDVVGMIVNPLGVTADSVGGDYAKSVEWKSAAKIFKDRDYWSAEVEVAGTALGGEPIAPGVIWGMNLYCNRQTSTGGEKCAAWPVIREESGLYPLVVFSGASGTATTRPAMANSPQ